MSRTPASQPDLFALEGGPPPPSVMPPGMVYEDEFLTREEERQLLSIVRSMPLAPMRYKGYTAKRHVLSFGGSYDFDANQLGAAPPIPPALEPLRTRVARWLGVEPAQFTQMLLAEYAPGTPLGWHRDVPDFEDVVGVSLQDEAVLRFRPYPPDAPRREDVIRLTVQPRSIYLLRGPARWAWQHSVAPTRRLRYSITLRTARLRAT